MEHESIFSEILPKCKAQSGSLNLQSYQEQEKKKNIQTYAQGKMLK